MLNHHSDCKLKKVYIVNRIYKVGREKFSSVVFVSFDEKKAWEQLERLKKVINPNDELLEVIARTIDDTFIVDTIIEAETENVKDNKFRQGSRRFNVKDNKFRQRSRRFYDEILKLWGGVNNVS